MNLPIITFPNEILKRETEKIRDPKSPEIRALVFDMLETMEKTSNCLGLAAPQVGKAVRLCIIKLDGKTHILINPEIKSKSWAKIVMEEGCLSFPGEFMPIKRPKKVIVVAQDRDGQEMTLKADGLLARALQHEIDHLDGILFIERVSKKIKK